MSEVTKKTIKPFTVNINGGQKTEENKPKEMIKPFTIEEAPDRKSVV